MHQVVFFYIVLSNLIGDVEGHGYMSIPPSRTQIHRGAYKGPGDLQSFNLGGLCGLDGDMLAGGSFPQYGPTFPQVSYKEGDLIEIKVVVTAHHQGWFEFRLCKPADGGVNYSIPITQECLNEHVLEFDKEFTENQYNGLMENGISSPADYANVPEDVRCDIVKGHSGSCCQGGGTCSQPADNTNRWVLPRRGAVLDDTYMMKYKLPDGISCERCVLQWHWQTGNSPWSMPEGFWGCADIKISQGGNFNSPVASPSPISSPTRPSGSLPTESPSDPNKVFCRSTVQFIKACRIADCDDQTYELCQWIDAEGNINENDIDTNNLCKSKVSHVSDQWCQAVNCDEEFIDFCGYVKSIDATLAPTSAILPGKTECAKKKSHNNIECLIHN